MKVRKLTRIFAKKGSQLSGLCPIEGVIGPINQCVILQKKNIPKKVIRSYYSYFQLIIYCQVVLLYYQEIRINRSTQSRKKNIYIYIYYYKLINIWQYLILSLNAKIFLEKVHFFWSICQKPNQSLFKIVSQNTTQSL